MPKDARSITPSAMREHVYSIAAAFNIDIVEDPHLNLFHQRLQTHFDWWGRVSGRTAYVLPIDNAFIYAVALHELGHAIAPNGDAKTYPFEAENSAWEWAEHVALMWNEEMEIAKTMGLLGHAHERQAA